MLACLCWMVGQLLGALEKRYAGSLVRLSLVQFQYSESYRSNINFRFHEPTLRCLIEGGLNNTGCQSFPYNLMIL